MTSTPHPFHGQPDETHGAEGHADPGTRGDEPDQGVGHLGTLHPTGLGYVGHPCPTCNGRGRVIHADAGFMSVAVGCFTCAGTGRLNPPPEARQQWREETRALIPEMTAHEAKALGDALEARNVHPWHPSAADHHDRGENCGEIECERCNP